MDMFSIWIPVIAKITYLNNNNNNNNNKELNGKLAMTKFAKRLPEIRDNHKYIKNAIKDSILNWG